MKKLIGILYTTPLTPDCQFQNCSLDIFLGSSRVKKFLDLETYTLMLPLFISIRIEDFLKLKLLKLT